VRERGQDSQAYREDAAGRHGPGGDEVLQWVAAGVADALQEFGVTGKLAAVFGGKRADERVGGNLR
jgi:hypothetical protein